MTTKKIYSPWIKWYGGECPVMFDQEVMVKLRGGGVLGPGRSVNYDWSRHEDCIDIMEYCTVTEQVDLGAAEQLLRDNGYIVTKPLTFEDVVPMTEVPPAGTKYWVISLADQWGVMPWRSEGGMVEKNFIKRRVAYLDKEHALIAARHIFGLKGGGL